MKMLRGISKGLPQTGLQGGAGVGIFYVHRMLASKIAFLQNHPLAAPLGFIIAGHVLKKSKKLSTVGAALVGAGGYAGAQVFELSKASKTANTPAAGTAGVDDDDTGMLVQPHEVGMLVQPHDVSGEWNSPGAGSSYNQSPGGAYEDAYNMSST